MTAHNASPVDLKVDGQVLAALDLSAYATSTSHYAAWAASRLNAPLKYLHVLDRHPETASTADFSGNLVMDDQQLLLQELAALDESRSRLQQQRGRLLLQQAKEVAEKTYGIAAETQLRHGSLVDTLTELEADVRLFVLGKRGEHADFATGHLGGQLERVVRAVHRPILVASRQYADIKRVVIAFDGSATTRKGVEMVATSPLFQTMEIRVITVGAENDANRQSLEWALKLLTAAGFSATGAILSGDPEDTIANYIDTEAVDLLIMGAYGHSRIRQLIIGSTTTAMLRRCQIPVLLLR